MAALSLKLRATARAPISSALDSRVKCTPSMLRSAFRSRSCPTGVGITAQSSPISGERRRSFWTMLSSVTRHLSRSRGYQPRGKFFPEHFAEILFHFAFERRQKTFGDSFPDHLHGGRAQIPCGIAGAPRDCDNGVLSLRNFQQGFHPACRGLHGQHLIDRAVEELP